MLFHFGDSENASRMALQVQIYRSKKLNFTIAVYVYYILLDLNFHIHLTIFYSTYYIHQPCQPEIIEEN